MSSKGRIVLADHVLLGLALLRFPLFRPRIAVRLAKKRLRSEAENAMAGTLIKITDTEFCRTA